MFIWKIITELFFYITLPFLYMERVIHKKTEGFTKKIGFCKNFDSNSDIIMLHGCSVGEITAVEGLAKRIKREFPNTKLIITTSTLTGQKVAHNKLSEIADYITFYPLDVPSVVNRFLRRIKPTVVLIAETEIWPNFAYACKHNNIPLYIVNGRISDSSYGAYKFGKFFFKKVLNYYSGIFTQSKEDSEKFISLGTYNDNTIFMGNLKFGLKKIESDTDLGQNGYQVILAGSTHKIENQIIIEIFNKLKQNHQDIKLLIAPRHLERVSDIETICKNFNMKYGLRSNNDKFSEQIDVIILDTLGELKYMYPISKVAFIGGSLNNTGGHNPLEASICSVPVISGPQIFNFKDIYYILEKAGAAKVVKNSDELYDELSLLINDSEYYEAAKKSCQNVFDEQKDAEDFVVNILRKHFN